MNDFKFFKTMSLEEQLSIMDKVKEMDEYVNVEKPYRLKLIESPIPAKYKANALRKINSLNYMDPGSGEYYKVKQWVDTFMQNGEQKKAIKILEFGIKKNDNADLKYRMVSLLLEMKKEAEGLEMLNKAMVKDFSELAFLYEVYPKALKNKKLKLIIEDFRKNNSMNQEPGFPDPGF